MNPNRDWSRGEKWAAGILAVSFAGPIPVAAHEQDIRMGVQKRVIDALTAKGVEVDPRWMQGKLMSRDQTYTVPGGHYRYDANTHTLTFYKSEVQGKKDC